MFFCFRFETTSDGRVTVKQGASLDREIADSFDVVVTATDGGGSVTKQPLHIIITDVNDNPPQFTKTNAELALEVFETLPQVYIGQVTNCIDCG